MKHLFNYCLVGLILLIPFSGKSQDDKVNKIRVKYYEASAFIDKQKSEETPKYNYELEINHVLPGIGPQTQLLNFYFKTEQDNDGKFHYFPVAIHRQYNVAGRLRIYEEFLYDNNQLIFYFDRVTGDECGEIRLYFWDDQVIKTIASEAKGCPAENQLYPEENSGETYIYKMDYATQQAAELLNIFNDISAFLN